MSAIGDAWNGLSVRDRRVLVWGAWILGLIAAWLLIWEPAREARDAARIRASSAATDLAYMRAAAPQLQALSGNTMTTSARDGRSLLAMVDATARESAVGEALLRVEPITGEQVRVYFESASFDALVEWLSTLETSQGVRVLDFNATRADGVGRVDSRVVLERVGA